MGPADDPAPLLSVCVHWHFPSLLLLGRRLIFNEFLFRASSQRGDCVCCFIGFRRRPRGNGISQDFPLPEKEPNSDELGGHGLARVIGRFKGEFQAGPHARSCIMSNDNFSPVLGSGFCCVASRSGKGGHQQLSPVSYLCSSSPGKRPSAEARG